MSEKDMWISDETDLIVNDERWNWAAIVKTENEKRTRSLKMLRDAKNASNIDEARATHAASCAEVREARTRLLTEIRKSAKM